MNHQHYYVCPVISDICNNNFKILLLVHYCKDSYNITFEFGELQMFFPEDEPQVKRSTAQRLVYIYQNGQNESKPQQFKIGKRRQSFKNIQKTLDYPHLRLFNSQGAEYFEDDLQFVKNKTVLYASNGEDFDPASCFGQYQMVKKLGEGGFGQVLLARHKQTGQEFAIKIIKTDKVGSSSEIDGIFVQAETLKSLKHDNIVKVHNCLTLKNMQVAIIMQFLEGGQLLQYVQKQGKLDEQSAKVFFKQIVKAMNYCHSFGLIHRDLKLQNMLLVNNENKNIKIIDFGIAGVIKSMTWEDLDAGSLSYMAPQCFIQNKNYKVDGRIDVWSTGVILYAMVTGELPFKGNTSEETIECIKAGKYKVNSAIAKKLSNQCLDIISKCLEVDPKNRPTMEELLAHPWLSGNIFQPKPQKIEPIIEEQKQVKKQQIPKKKAAKPTVSPKLASKPVLNKKN